MMNHGMPMNDISVAQARTRNPFAKTKQTLRHIFFVGTLFLSLYSNYSQAQCAAGTQEAILNWDYLDYLIYSGNYTSGNGYLASNAWSQSQYFAFGTQRLRIQNNYTNANIIGDNTTHSGEGGTYGDVNGSATDADIQFIGNGQIVLTFENEVSNVRFSMYDIDRNQIVGVIARNTALALQNVTMATFGTSILTLTNNGTPTAQAAAAGSNRGNASLEAALDISIAGPVKTITINISNTSTGGGGGGEDGSFWISDILACSAGTFPSNYYQVSQPFTGQPGYILHAFDKSVYAVDPLTGVTKFLFTDPYIVGASGSTNRWNINSMGYDPYNRFLYYVYSITSNPAANRVLKKYDFNTGTISTVLADINSIGIPTTTTMGIESGSAAFYNGSLYIGIETSNSSRDSDREAVIWRIDFDASNVPYRSSQVYAVPVDNGSNLVHDWGDFAISNGTLYNFDGAGSTGSTELDVYEFNLQNGSTLNFSAPTYVPGQNAVSWNENVYDLYSLSPTTPYVAPYNKGLGTIGTTVNITSTPAYSPANPSLGDAAEAFRPLMDFGDAPATYDPLGTDPAMHETLSTLRLGNATDIEWLGTSSALADADGADEDGIGGTPPLLNYLGTLTYTISINVFNNTGANATLIGWLDYDFDGVFDASEGVSVTVPSSASVQSVPVIWNSITVPNTSNVQTFVRFRLARATDGLTTTKMNGWVANGEVEDYPVLIGVALPNNNLTVQAHKNNNATVTLNWSHQSDLEVKYYTIQKSTDGRNWNEIGTVSGGNNKIKKEYSYTDQDAINGNHFYRLQINYETSRKEYSAILSVSNHSILQAMKISPNPANSSTNLTVSSSGRTDAIVTVIDYSGKTVMESKYLLYKGNNILTLQGLDKLNKGIYIVRLKTDEKTETTKLVISR